MVYKVSAAGNEIAGWLEDNLTLQARVDRIRAYEFSQQACLWFKEVDEERFDYVIPESMPEEYVEDYCSDMETIQKMYAKWRQRGLKKEDARFVLPNACTSEIVVSANFREWRHILQIRMSKKAQWEIRNACRIIYDILKRNAPNCFDDITEMD